MHSLLWGEEGDDVRSSQLSSLLLAVLPSSNEGVTPLAVVVVPSLGSERDDTHVVITNYSSFPPLLLLVLLSFERCNSSQHLLIPYYDTESTTTTVVLQLVQGGDQLEALVVVTGGV